MADATLVTLLDEWICDARCDPTCDAYCGPNGPACVVCTAKFLAAKLAESGRLLPPGGEVSTQWMAQCLDANDKIREVTFWLFRPDAERWAKDRIGANEIVRYALLSHEIRRYEDGSQYIGPWSPVVSDNSEGESSG